MLGNGGGGSTVAMQVQLGGTFHSPPLHLADQLLLQPPAQVQQVCSRCHESNGVVACTSHLQQAVA